MEEEKQILINYLSQNGFSKESADLYVNSLSKKPEEPTDLKFSTILELVKFTLNLDLSKIKTLDLTEPVKSSRIDPLKGLLDDFIAGNLNEDEVNKLITQFDDIKNEYKSK
ncbi:hypothetical protein LPB90_18370 [Chryseobacterium sp. LC2016-29]|uniref:hypothetical protein n=1 Tax=Chryseobacterium sp. LC2016-29 TaxID=2897331 RepID=UPI001E50B7ED|nr:hypothetical protein [Chryseobacterium sp. LC2016-29]MCD0480408.1 hypothetical protein [Chryseobacterium sp. LC2016-29]